MSDELMNARLHAAGERWRAANSAAAQPARIGQAAAAPTETIEAPFDGPHRRRRWTLVASAAAVVAALGIGTGFLVNSLSGTTDGATDAAGVRGTVWQLVGYGGAAAADSSLATLHIDARGHLVADDDCAVIGGSVDLGSGSLTVSNQIVRYRSCIDQHGTSFGERGRTILAGRSSYTIDGGMLTIKHAGQPAMHLVAAPAWLPAPTLDVPTFVGADWQLLSAKDSSGRSMRVTPAASLHVADNGRFTAGDGCNTLSGRLTSSAGRVRIGGGVAATEIGCPGSIAKLTGLVDSMLSGTVNEVVAGGVLTITKPGVGELVYRWAPESGAADPDSLAGVTWQLVGVARARVVAGASLRFGGNAATFSATDGCRSFSGAASFGAGRMLLAGIPTARPACRGTVGDQAQTIDSFLAGGQWAIRDGKLLIYGGAAQAFALVYTAPGSYTAAPPALVQHRWTLASMEVDGAGTATNESSADPLELTFADGRFTLAERCGAEGGSVRIDATSITFSGRHVTQVHSCPSAIDQAAVDRQLDLVHGVVAGTATWSVKDRQLTVTRARVTLTFTRS